MKKCVLILFLIIVMSFVVNSETILEYNETDLINLRPSASDPDEDTLTYFFTYPLTNQGTWQTDYGDEGIYHTKATVSDGRLLTVENITLIILKKEESPVIEILAPKKEDIYIIEDKSVFFNIKATDINKDELSITWIIDGKEVSNQLYYTYESDFYSEGIHNIMVLVSDGTNEAFHKWSVEVEDVDRAALLDDFISLTVNEAELVKLSLPDFGKYSLFYNISEPLGNKAEWLTTYDDAGLYTVIIDIWDDKDFEAEKKIKILVENIDRPPVFVGEDSIMISENQELEFFLNYTDPDEDRIEIIVDNLPQGAKFRNNVITWKPDFDVVSKDTLLDDIAGRYHLMNRLFIINISAVSKELTSADNIKIRVFDTNRQPILGDIPEITINEGETIDYQLSAFDPDNDTLSYSFDGFNDNYETKYGQAGTYEVKVTVSDGFLHDEKYAKVTILPVNQPPVLKNIPSVVEDENGQIEIVLEAEDPDDDDLTYSVLPLPKGAYFRDNKFIWQLDYDAVIGGDAAIYDLQFIVEDGQFNATKNTEITVNNVNRPLLLTTSAQVDKQEFYTGEEIFLFVDVHDPDIDELKYTWQTGLFSTFEGNNTFVVKYSKPGKKKVSVTASDGEFTIRREWEFTIKKRPELKLQYFTK